MPGFIDIYVPAVPVAQPRVRATSRGKHAAVYNPTVIKNADGSSKPHPIAAFKAGVRHEAFKVFKSAPLQGPLSISLIFVFPRPQSMIWKTRPMPRARHVTKPDRDNLDKAVLDALKGLVISDDCQVCEGSIEKWYAAGDEQSHVEITICELTNEP